MTTATKIKAIRNRAGLSQLQLAEKLGLSRPRISEYETGKHEPSYETMMKIIKACKL